MTAPPKNKQIRDAVHGDIEFDSFELTVINTPEFQRMRGIRQLGLAHLVYPCAQHTRFEHCLGVAHMATRIVEAVRKNCGADAISEHDLRFVRAWALVHDIGHIPFGHTLEDERPVYDDDCHHDEEKRLSLFFRGTELEKALLALGRDLGVDDLAGNLMEIMKLAHERSDSKSSDPRNNLLARIVGNTICADLLDYLRRDPYFTGIHHSYDEKILSAFEVRDSQIFLNLQEANQVRHGVLSEILHLLRLRYTLGERVYYHLTKASAGAMISKAVELSGLSHSILARLRDEELLYLLENASSKPKPTYVRIDNAQQTSSLVRKIRCRRLYVPVYVISRSAAEAKHKIDNLTDSFFKASNRALRMEVETTIARLAGVEPDQVIIYCPDKEMSTKAAMVDVLWPQEEKPSPLQDLCEKGQGIEDKNTRDEILQLKHKHEALWQLTVFVDPDCTKQQQEDVAAHCEATKWFYQIPNALAEFTTPPEKQVTYRNLARALVEIPEGRGINVQATQELLISAFHKGGDIPSVDEFRKAMLTLAGATTADADRPGVGQQQLIPNQGPESGLGHNSRKA